MGALGLISVIALAASAAQARDEAPVWGEVAYTRGDARSWISVADLAGAGVHEITQPPGEGASWADYGPVWSPDGSWLAFVRERRNGSGSGLYVANRDGTGLRRVLRLPADRLADSDYSWSPDGRRLAFANGPLYIVNRDGTTSQKLVPSSTCNPVWSPNGRTLLYLVDAAPVAPCANERGGNTPDPGYRSIYRIDADGSHRRQLATGSFGDASWSPDGHQIAFTDGCQAYHGGDWYCSVSLMSADGSSKRRLVKNSYGSSGWVEWAAGGEEVLWPDYPAFWASNVATGRVHRVLPAGYKEGYPVGMSGDGQRIAVVAAVSSPHPAPLIIVTPSGRLIQKVTVPRGWVTYNASVYLR